MVNKTLLLFTLCLVLMLCVQKCFFERTTSTANEEASVVAAATDSVRYYRDHYNRVTAQKRVIEANLDAVEKHYNLLTANQRALVQDMKHQPRTVQQNAISNTSVKQEIRVVHVDSVPAYANHWIHESDTLNYSIRVEKNSLHIDSLTIPNRIILTHYTDSKDVIHVTATNTNSMIKTTDADSIIPPRKKKSSLPKILIVIGAFIAGAILTH